MGEKKAKVSSKVDLQGYSEYSLGCDPLLSVYNQAVRKGMSCVVIADVFPYQGNSPYYSARNFLENLELLKLEDWKPKIPIILGLEYVWPSWLTKGVETRTIVIGEKAIEQLLGLERYRKIDGVDPNGNILKKVEEEAYICDLDLGSDTQSFRLIIPISGSSSFVQTSSLKDSGKWSSWLTTNISVKNIPKDAILNKNKGIIDIKVPTGENINDVWNQFKLALTHELVEDDYGLDYSVGNPINSAVILKTFEESQIRKGSYHDLVPDYFLEIVDAVEISYNGVSKKKGGINYSQEAYNFADQISSLPVINSNAKQSSGYGIADPLCNQFKVEIKNEQDLINAILEQKVTKNHFEKIEEFVASAKEIEIDSDGLAKNEEAANELGILFSTGENDEF